MLLPGVSETIVDGGMGIIPPNAEIQGIVGNANTGTAEVIQIIGSPTEAKNVFGAGTLLEKILDIFSVRNAPSKVYAVRADPTGGTAADKGTPAADGGNSSTGVVATTGTPTNDRQFKIVITNGGVDGSIAAGGVKVKVSENDGLTYGSEISLAASSPATVVLGNGTSATLTDDATPAGSFVKDDFWTWRCTELKATTAELIDAIEALTLDRSVGRVYVAEGIDSTFAASMSAHNSTLIALHQYVTFVLEAIPPAAGEATATWLSGLQTEWASFYDYTIMVGAGMGYVADIYGKTLPRNMGGIACGLRGSAKVQESIGYVRGFPIGNMIGVYPADLTIAQIETLYDDRFTMFREWDGNGFRCVGTRMMATDTSDFQRLEWLETLYKFIRLTRAKAIAWVEGLGDPEGSLAFQEDIKQPGENMKTQKEIRDYQLTLLETDVLGTGEIAVEGVIEVIGIMKKIRFVFGLGRIAA